jgi:hypothetical protein
MNSIMADVFASIRAYKVKVGKQGTGPYPVVVNCYGARAIIGLKDPYASSDSRLKDSSNLLKIDLANCLQYLDIRYSEEEAFRRSLVFIDCLTSNSYDQRWPADQVQALGRELGVEPEALLEAAQQAQLISRDRSKTPPLVMRMVKREFRNAQLLTGKNRDEEIQTILQNKCESLFKRLQKDRSSYNKRIGQACMRIASGGPENMIHRVSLNTKIGLTYINALSYVWNDVLWVNPTDIFVPGAKGEEYMHYFWLRVYESKIYNVFAFEDSRAIDHYWDLRQGANSRAGREIPHEYLDDSLQTIAPLDPQLGSIGLKEEYNLGLVFLGADKTEVPLPGDFQNYAISKIPGFEMVMLNVLEMPDKPFPVDQIVYHGQ